MVDKEMLSAISDLLEEKLDAKFDQKLQPLYDRMDSVEEKIGTMEEKIDSIEGEIGTIKVQISTMEEKIGTIEGEVGTIKGELNTVNQRLDTLEQGVRHISVVQLENNVIPRLSTMESCYLDTYQRYQKSTEKIDGMGEDIEVLKHTVLNHSSKLAQLSV